MQFAMYHCAYVVFSLSYNTLAPCGPFGPCGPCGPYNIKEKQHFARFVTVLQLRWLISTVPLVQRVLLGLLVLDSLDHLLALWVQLCTCSHMLHYNRYRGNHHHRQCTSRKYEECQLCLWVPCACIQTYSSFDGTTDHSSCQTEKKEDFCQLHTADSSNRQKKIWQSLL